MSSSPTPRRFYASALLALAAAPLALGACGSKTDTNVTGQPAATSGPSTTSSPDSSAPGTTARPQGTSTTTARSQSTTTTTAKTNTSVNPQYAGWCGQLDQVKKDFEAMTVDDLKDEAAFLRKIQTAFQGLTTSAPAPVKADMEMFNTYIQSVKSAAETGEQPGGIADANKRINEFAKANCGQSFDS